MHWIFPCIYLRIQLWQYNVFIVLYLYLLMYLINMQYTIVFSSEFFLFIFYQFSKKLNFCPICDNT